MDIPPIERNSFLGHTLTHALESLGELKYHVGNAPCCSRAVEQSEVAESMLATVVRTLVTKE